MEAFKHFVFACCSSPKSLKFSAAIGLVMLFSPLRPQTVFVYLALLPKIGASEFEVRIPKSCQGKRFTRTVLLGLCIGYSYFAIFRQALITFVNFSPFLSQTLDSFSLYSSILVVLFW